LLKYNTKFIFLSAFFKIFISLLLLTSIACFGQDKALYDFAGFLKLADSSIITYKVSFRLTDEQNFEGHSITDVYGTEKTKTSIKGNWTKNRKTISFKEISNITTKSDAEDDEFCFVNVTNATVKTKGGKRMIEGVFNGVFANEKPCASGKIFLIGTNFITDKPAGKDSSKSENTVKTLIQKTNETKLKAEETLVLNTTSSKIFLEIWDGMKEDNDRISVLVNNIEVLTDYELSNTKKIIEVPLDGQECIIQIIAINEGQAPPNTAQVLLRNDELSTPLITSLKKGEKASIKIKQKASK
jgi:hypothetical protein